MGSEMCIRDRRQTPTGIEPTVVDDDDDDAADSPSGVRDTVIARSFLWFCLAEKHIFGDFFGQNCSVERNSVYNFLFLCSMVFRVSHQCVCHIYVLWFQTV